MAERPDEEHTGRDASGERQDADTDAMQFGDRESEREVSYEDVRKRAHAIYLERGGADGDPLADWLEAERQIRGRSRPQPARDDPPDIEQRF